MYTIVLNDTNELVTTVKERIMQRSKLVDNLHFLVDPDYKGIDMTDYTVLLEYLMPISREYRTEILVKSSELYKDKLEYKLPMDTTMTAEHGEIELQLTFLKVDMNPDGSSVQRVRKTSPTKMTILPIAAWSDIIADSALTALDQRLIQVDAMLNAVNDMNIYLNDNKADNIVRSNDGKYLQLTANGNPIGDKIALGIPCCEDGPCVKAVKIDEDGNLLVAYSDGTVENIGKAVGDVVSGIYIPDVSEDGIMTMTLSNEVGETSYSWDINPFNDWNEIEGVEGDSDYVWEEL